MIVLAFLTDPAVVAKILASRIAACGTSSCARTLLTVADRSRSTASAPWDGRPRGQGCRGGGPSRSSQRWRRIRTTVATHPPTAVTLEGRGRRDSRPASMGLVPPGSSNSQRITGRALPANPPEFKNPAYGENFAFGVWSSPAEARKSPPRARWGGPAFFAGVLRSSFAATPGANGDIQPTEMALEPLIGHLVRPLERRAPDRLSQDSADSVTAVRRPRSKVISSDQGPKPATPSASP